jgi:hypothetical protein
MTAKPTALRPILKSQYHASLAMLEEAIRRCPDDLWDDPSPTNAFWQVAYHTLFFTHLYLHHDEAAFQPWHGHQREVQQEDSFAGPPIPNSTLPITPTPYTKAQVLEYWTICDGMVDEAVDGLDLDRTECGFHWYTMSKLEHQFVNIRHVQHHTAQLADRLRAAAGMATPWVGARHGQ